MGSISPLLSRIGGLRHDFGTRAEPIAHATFPEWDAAKPDWKQTHGIRVAEVPAARSACGETDALVSFRSDAPIAVVTADCVPILLSRKDGTGVAAVHAGWRGTRARILEALFRHLTARGEYAVDWVAAIGPAIGPCCYEVSEELATDFAAEFGSSAVPRHRHLDLPGINRETLRALGVHEVEVLGQCTRCSKDGAGEWAFHSFRREGGGTRQYSMIAPKVSR